MPALAPPPPMCREYINLTPHIVRLNSGKEIPPSGKVARVSVTFSSTEPVCEDSTFSAKHGDLAPPFGEWPRTEAAHTAPAYIVSLLVLQALKETNIPQIEAGWGDLGSIFLAPASGHPDVVRDADGQIFSVPGFVR